MPNMPSSPLPARLPQRHSARAVNAPHSACVAPSRRWGSKGSTSGGRRARSRGQAPLGDRRERFNTRCPPQCWAFLRAVGGTPGSWAWQKETVDCGAKGTQACCSTLTRPAVCPSAQPERGDPPPSFPSPLECPIDPRHAPRVRHAQRAACKTLSDLGDCGHARLGVEQLEQLARLGHAHQVIPPVAPSDNRRHRVPRSAVWPGRWRRPAWRPSGWRPRAGAPPPRRPRLLEPTSRHTRPRPAPHSNLRARAAATHPPRAASASERRAM